MAVARVATSIDLGLPVAYQTPVTTTAALLRPITVTTEDVKDPEVLARAVTTLQLELHSSTQVQRSHPEQGPITFKRVSCPTGNAKIFLPHGFGRHAEFIVTKWSGDGVLAGPALISDEDDSTGALTDVNTLVLRSGVAGTANIRVYPGT